jgi:hypothetical protein
LEALIANSLARSGIETEAISSTKPPKLDEKMKTCVPLPTGQDQQQLRTVDEEAGGELARARLQEGRLRVAPMCIIDGQDGEDGADRDIGLDVRRAVERIDRQRQRALRVDDDRLVLLLGAEIGDSGGARRFHENPVGNDIELLLDVAPAVRRLAGRALMLADRAVHDRVADLDGGGAELPDRLGDLPPRRVGIALRSEIGVERRWHGGFLLGCRGSSSPFIRGNSGQWRAISKI